MKFMRNRGINSRPDRTDADTERIPHVINLPLLFRS